MSLSLYSSLSLHVLLLSLVFRTSTSTSVPPLCHDDEKFALLQFKQSFLISKLASGDPSAYPKVASWKLRGESSDCCLWDGVKCDEDTGHVISLDLSSSCLYGSINSSTSLFRLVHLQRLNLGDNDFNFSQIPSQIGLLTRLMYLNLSDSHFYGQIPSEITELCNLSSLDLSHNVDSSEENLLELNGLNLKRLVTKLTKLEKLDLSFVNISSTLPDISENLSSLTFLNLKHCNLWGPIPSSLGKLTKLHYLNLLYNDFSGQIPSSLANLTQLNILSFASNKFTGLIPSWLANLTQLNELYLNDNNFTGHVPSSLANLAQLNYLDLSYNNFTGHVPSWLANSAQLNYLRLSYNNFTAGDLSWVGKQNKLTYLYLSGINLFGEIPSSLRNLTLLRVLLLCDNQLTGQIPLWISNLTQLTSIEIGPNEFHGPIPESISKLVNLEILNLQFNHLTGTLKLDMFSSLKHLTALHIPHNNLTLVTKSSINSTLPKFEHLGLADCNVHEFPEFLKQQDELGYLDLRENEIHGQIPKWIGDVGKETLSFLFLSDNFFTGFEQSSALSLFTNLRTLVLDNNELQGSLPVPPLSTVVYQVSNNSLTGEISPLLCNLGSLASLDLSYNNLSGMIPQCLGNLSDSLSVLNLANNFFHGNIPKVFTNGSSLRMIDLSHNQLEGRLPRSFANCRMLEILDLSENHISDEFPLWLGALPKLEVLLLRSNQFIGAIRSPSSLFKFPMLRIIDLSNNNFTGILQSEFFETLSSMKFFDQDQLTYMEAYQGVVSQNYFTVVNRYYYQIILANKGMYRKYWKIPNLIAAIDLSSNRFEGGIPQSIGNLKMVNVLNLSNNLLSGDIPSGLGTLTKLESLDLSHNMLSGEIPPQLTELTFLGYFNVSHNRLEGRIPQGKQFNTFDNSSYEGNVGLCGDPLSKKCGKSEASSPPLLTFEEDEGSSFLSGIDLIIILLGYGSGLVVGVVIGHRFTSRKHELFVKTFGRSQMQPKRGRIKE